MNNFITLRKKRDFSQKLNATFEFIRHEYKTLLTSTLLISGPPIVICAILMTTYMNQFNSGLLRPDATEQFLTATFWIKLLVILVLSIASYASVLAVSNCNLALHDETKGAGYTVNDVMNMVREKLGLYISTIFQYYFLFLLFTIILFVPTLALASISGFLGALVMMGFMIFVVWAFVATSMVFTIRHFENQGFIDACRRSIKLVHNKWWSTFGVLFVSSFLAAMCGYVFSFPALFLQMSESLHSNDIVGAQEPSVVVIILNSLGYIFQMLAYFIPSIALAMQYFNLVELKESKGLMEELSSLGNTPKPAQDTDQF